MALLYTRALLEFAEYGIQPLDLESFRSTFTARRWSDFIEKARKRGAYKGFATAPDLVITKNERRICVVEVSRRSGSYRFANPENFDYGGIKFENGKAEAFEKFVESFNVVFGELTAASLDAAYDGIWQHIIAITGKEKISFSDVEEVDKFMVSRGYRYAHPQIEKTFFVNARKLDTTWVPQLESLRRENGESFEFYYVLWMDNLRQGFNFCMLGDITSHKGEMRRERGEPFYEIPMAVMKPMRAFPLFAQHQDAFS